MALNKTPININFAKGLDTKTDPWQVQTGNMLMLNNAVFNKGGQLQKRNGFGTLSNVPSGSPTTLATYKDNLVAIGTNLQAKAGIADAWVETGPLQPVSVSTSQAVRTSTGQLTVDLAVSSTGLACTTWVDTAGLSYYQILEQETGQIIIPATQLPATTVVSRVNVFGTNFIITFIANVSGTVTLQYIAVPINNPSLPGTPVNLSTVPNGLTAAFDVVVANNSLLIAFDGADSGGAVRIVYLDSTLVQHTTKLIVGAVADKISITNSVNSGSNIIWVTYYTVSSTTTTTAGFVITGSAASAQLTSLFSPVSTITSQAVAQLTTLAIATTIYIYFQVSQTYSYSSVRTDLIKTVQYTIGGSPSAAGVLFRGAAIASKPVFLDTTGSQYFLIAYGADTQVSLEPTYFLVDNGSRIIAKIASGNGGGYPVNQILTNVYLENDTLTLGYLYKSTLTSVNKAQGVTKSTGVYAQTGINIASFNINNSVNTAELGESLHITGGFLWMFDGAKPVEHGFFVYPENMLTVPHTSGGAMIDQDYYYVATYEWTDAQGNLNRSAPSIPILATVSGGSGAGSVTVNIPTLRLTYKTNTNLVRIVLYRWSTAQQNYYQITPINSPIVNNPNVDSIAYVDTLADSSILGNTLLYTTGGVVENIVAPATDILTLFQSRLFLVDAEDPNLLWYSKQVIQETPVEMSDLFTIYVTPTLGAQGSTGPITALAPMDDKLIIFKKNAIYYISGVGPDNTGAQNGFSEPIFVTSTLGCDNPDSVVLTPSGLMFQAKKEIWLLDRQLSTSYVGAPVEEYTAAIINSALSIPNTNQIRFTTNDGNILMYDYYFGQWGTFDRINAISSTVYQNLHTILTPYYQVRQEAVGKYVDGSVPVTLSFTTSWFNLAGLQGYERFYYFYMLGKYLSPHTLQIELAYDYSPSPSQTIMITPDNYSPTWGGLNLWGSGSTWGGESNVEQWRVFPQLQKCESFQITIKEIYDASFGVTPGAGLTLSGLNAVVGLKKGYTTIRASRSAGG